MGKTTKVDREKIKSIREALIGNADDLQAASLHPTGPGDFGASATGSTLADDADRARHHVLETARKMGGGVGGFADALKRAVSFEDETEGQVQADVGAIDSSVSTIATQFADPSNRKRPGSGHGRTS